MILSENVICLFCSVSGKRENTMEEFDFNVNLGGMMDLLSNHLYSTPKVFLRELLQNAADAISLRQAHGMDEEPKIEIIITEKKSLVFKDNGSGLTGDEIHRFISVIGQSSKKDNKENILFRQPDQQCQGLLGCGPDRDFPLCRRRSQ